MERRKKTVHVAFLQRPRTIVQRLYSSRLSSFSGVSRARKLTNLKQLTTADQSEFNVTTACRHVDIISATRSLGNGFRMHQRLISQVLVLNHFMAIFVRR